MTEFYFEHEVAGFQCVIHVTNFQPAMPARTWGTPESWAPAEPGTVEFEVLDEDEGKAPWLENQMTESDIECIEEEAARQAKLVEREQRLPL